MLVALATTLALALAPSNLPHLNAPAHNARATHTVMQFGQRKTSGARSSAAPRSTPAARAPASAARGGGRKIATPKVIAPISGKVTEFKGSAPSRPKVTAKAKPLSPGSNFPATKNIQTQSSGFGNFLQRFQKADGKSKYGMPIFLKNGNINPAYLAAERAEIRSQSKKNVQAEAAKTKRMKANKTFELDDFIRKEVGNVGSGKEYYQSGR